MKRLIAARASGEEGFGTIYSIMMIMGAILFGVLMTMSDTQQEAVALQKLRTSYEMQVVLEEMAKVIASARETKKQLLDAAAQPGAIGPFNCPGGTSDSALVPTAGYNAGGYPLPMCWTPLAFDSGGPQTCFGITYRGYAFCLANGHFFAEHSPVPPERDLEALNEWSREYERPARESDKSQLAGWIGSAQAAGPRSDLAWAPPAVSVGVMANALIGSYDGFGTNVCGTPGKFCVSVEVCRKHTTCAHGATPYQMWVRLIGNGS